MRMVMIHQLVIETSLKKTFTKIKTTKYFKDTKSKSVIFARINEIGNGIYNLHYFNA